MSKGKSEELLDKEIAVLKANTNLSESELRGMYEEFMKEYPSAKINKDKFNVFYRKMMGSEEKCSHLLDHMFAAFDKNGDGVIDFSEFVLGIGVAQSKDLNTTLDFSFEMMDTSEDGYVSYEEVLKYIDAMKKMSNHDQVHVTAEMIASSIFNAFGLSKRHKLNKQQYMEGCKNNETLKSIFSRR